MKSRLSVSRLRESYVDTLSKLYHYSTSIYEKNRQSVLTGTDLAYTFGEFKRTTDGISKILTCYGIGAGSGVAILSQNHPNWGVAFFSAAAFHGSGGDQHPDPFRGEGYLRVPQVPPESQ